ncbi:hypothetical protein Y032_0197g1572 [Ancylostoma ceylanicum]|uniref:Methyltransferase domain-containing protein n=1 Tax=Ancylostoma ceylanicum TaxID=53326 RepID=A0A016SNI7_9BILA|nr:hypothetical protein Y032_0197g1572 [Ancylostoma ceylanicum]
MLWFFSPAIVTVILSVFAYFHLRRLHAAKGITGSETANLHQSNSNTTDDLALSKMTVLYQEQARDRHTLLRVATASNETGPYLSYISLYNIMAPEVRCPVKVRIGSVRGGGRWICNPFRIPKKSIVLSNGMRTGESFQAQLQNITNGCCHILDFVSTDLKELSSRYATTCTTELANQEYTKYIEILDIEGRELEALPMFLVRRRPAQIMVRIHSSVSTMALLLQLISLKGYWLFSHEIDGLDHEICGFYFVHESAFERYGVTPIARYLNLLSYAYSQRIY